VAAAVEPAFVAAAEAAAVAEGMSTGGGAGGCALRGMHMKRRAGDLAGTAKKPQTQKRVHLNIYPPITGGALGHLSHSHPTATAHTPHTHTAPRAARARTTRYADAGTRPSPRASHPGGTARGGCAINQFHWALSALPWRERAKAVTPYCNSKRGCEVGALCRSKSCAARPCTWSSYRTHRH